jgi:hypothetical protein
VSLWSIAVHLSAGHLIAKQGRATGFATNRSHSISSIRRQDLHMNLQEQPLDGARYLW